MYPQIIFILVVFTLLYNNYLKQYVQKPESKTNLRTDLGNQRIENILNTVGPSDVIDRLNSEEEFRNATKELDAKLEKIIKKDL
jgi:hypothetical protein